MSIERNLIRRAVMLSRIAIACILTALLAGLLPAQNQGDGKTPPVTEETIAEFQEVLDGLAKAVKEKSDVDVLYYSKEGVKKISGADAKQKGKFVVLVAKGLKSKNDEVRSNAIATLGASGYLKASKFLLKEAKSKRAKNSITYMCECIAALGKLADPKSLKDLSKFLNNKENRVIAAAINAMSDYRNASFKTRKNIVDILLKHYASVASPMTRPNPKTSDKQKFEALADSFESTLKILTKKTDLKGFDKWDRWYRKEGKKAKRW